MADKVELATPCRGGCGGYIYYLLGDAHPEVCADCVTREAKLNGLEVSKKQKPAKE